MAGDEVTGEHQIDVGKGEGADMLTQNEVDRCYQLRSHLRQSLFVCQT